MAHDRLRRLEPQARAVSSRLELLRELHARIASSVAHELGDSVAKRIHRAHSDLPSSSASQIDDTPPTVKQQASDDELRALVDEYKAQREELRRKMRLVGEIIAKERDLLWSLDVTLEQLNATSPT